MLSAFTNAFRTPDLRNKILFSLGIIVIFRLGSAIPIPNVNVQQVDTCRALAAGGQAGFASMLNMFSGGALLKLAIFALGVMPYITSSIILQLLTVVIPRLETLRKEGGQGQEKITQYTRYLTILLAVMQSTAFVTLAVNDQLIPGCTGLVYGTGLFPIIVMILTMTAGTSLVMWLGELITEKGVGNGMSVLIFTSVAAQFPNGLASVRQSRPGQQGWVIMGLVILVGLAVMAAVVYIEQGQRRIGVQYAKKMIGGKLRGGTSTYIPVKVNQAGVIPVIFASSMLYLPVLFSTFRPTGAAAQWVSKYFGSMSHPVYVATYAVLIIFFAYFYVAITFNTEEIADNMKKYGGFIPGIRAGRPTEKYLSYVLSRLTAPGSLYLALIALIPSIAFILFQANQNFPFGGTSLLIIVGVGLDTIKQIESKLQQHNYEGFLR
ncbi:preprotein translocase subunit SecY [Raineyella fluvialis]|uniref:Protein translocase subunit SecY n=1 Tax=Raineyella fluvialis TaxID=2662261 RepID=A0A5Q2F7C4_9ACTN|nr:preprotein translocase subunit SecY [Raineyella fluvialis]QGF22729.1 preprotein translocase subunit SecY [Raineyella fluvialis]